VGRKRDVRATSEWDVWREEAPWMTLYFSIGVWTSLAMVLLQVSVYLVFLVAAPAHRARPQGSVQMRG